MSSIYPISERSVAADIRGLRRDIEDLRKRAKMNVPTWPYGPYIGGGLATQVYDGACGLLGWELTNERTGFTYLHLFDYGTLGGSNTVPVKSFGVPPSMSANVPPPDVQFAFGVYITARTTSDPTSGAPGASLFVVNLDLDQPPA